jgi:flagellum-specific peptidoglycan hydrolase FlgJ
MTAKKHTAKKKTAKKKENKITRQEQFIIDLYPAARQVGDKTGMSWELILAQTAQETGWGQKVLPGTNNLYNIKTSADWKGQTKTFKVLEYQGKKKKKVWEDQAFRVYGNYQESLNDRVAFLRDNPRYAAAGLFKDGVKGNLRKEAQALQDAGYATDPNYADNIADLFDGRTMQRAIKEAQAQQPPSPASSAAPASR